MSNGDDDRVYNAAQAFVVSEPTFKTTKSFMVMSIGGWWYISHERDILMANLTQRKDVWFDKAYRPRSTPNLPFILHARTFLLAALYLVFQAHLFLHCGCGMRGCEIVFPMKEHPPPRRHASAGIQR